MRKLFSASRSCKADCQYCFARWNNMYCKLPNLESDNFSEKKAVMYPCCDGNFFDQNGLLESVKEMAKNMDKVYVSISTKSFISDEEIANLAQLNQELLSENKGFVKLGISLSNISMINKIEPGTISYAERLSIAKRIKETSILLGVTIKPILPFISTEEYCQIINDFSKYTKYFLIGGLYLNRKSKFFSNYITTEHLIQKRVVEWLPERPEWEYIEDDKQFQQIRIHAEKKGVLLFDSDVDLIKSYIGQEGMIHGV